MIVGGLELFVKKIKQPLNQNESEPKWADAAN